MKKIVNKNWTYKIILNCPSGDYHKEGSWIELNKLKEEVKG